MSVEAKALKVNVRLFATYRERVGTSELSFDLPEGATVGLFADEMARTYPHLISKPENLVVAVNQEYRDHMYSLKEDDEVALIPPVSGGSND